MSYQKSRSLRKSRPLETLIKRHQNLLAKLSIMIYDRSLTIRYAQDVDIFGLPARNFINQPILKFIRPVTGASRTHLHNCLANRKVDKIIAIFRPNTPGQIKQFCRNAIFEENHGVPLRLDVIPLNEQYTALHFIAIHRTARRMAELTSEFMVTVDERNRIVLFTEKLHMTS